MSNTEQQLSQSQANPPPTQKRPLHILLGITGSVASVKGPELALELARTLHAKVIVVLTKGGTNFWYKAKEYNKSIWNNYCNFVKTHSNQGGSSSNGNGSSKSDSNSREKDPQCQSVDDRLHEMSVFSMLEMQNVHREENDSIQLPAGEIAICHAEDEWDKWNKIGDPVLHIQLRDWADMMIIAPLSAHTLAKLSNGLCDDTLSCILRAWDYGYNSSSPSSSSSIISNSRDNEEHLTNDVSNNNCKRRKKEYIQKPIIVAPAMNTAMWEHPITQQQLETLRGFWKNDDAKHKTIIVDPQVKVLACGDVGQGAMADVMTIVDVVRREID